MHICIQNYLSSINSINDRPNTGACFTINGCISDYRQNPLCGTFQWPDSPTMTDTKTGVCQFIQHYMVRSVLCNTCAGPVFFGKRWKYDKEVTVCTCGAPFHFWCHAVKRGKKSLNYKDKNQYADTEKYEICCHACCSHSSTFKKKTKVNCLLNYIYNYHHDIEYNIIFKCIYPVKMESINIEINKIWRENVS